MRVDGILGSALTFTNLRDIIKKIMCILTADGECEETQCNQNVRIADRLGDICGYKCCPFL